MGLDITVLMADWERLARIPAAERLGTLTDTAYPDFCCDACWDADFAVPDGWVWPRNQEQPWCAEYRFSGTTGTYKWHFELDCAWEDMREFTEPGLREALETFLGGIVGEDSGGGDDGRPAGESGETAEPWHARLLLYCPPEKAAVLARSWEQAAPRLEQLRAPFEAEATRWACRPKTFDAMGALLREWGEVVTEAGRRGWGLVGLPW
ncbi:hypothetical protein [Streptomyces sp. NPDC048603]|uniref:hypothetical protein n=1 Tax=Streptomyces sp. NPDC048603 TaxID=3365577 RepID=UPI0037197975